ncbi:MAG: antibiotic biosynthesis monooxygenase [Planctomycetes bacterium]|nr:antibiotic biosynthesis monooxygenase [Planctomycetota bacterium]
MYIVCVHIQVKEGERGGFIAATLENARNTRTEPGNLRFDVLQKNEDPDSFMLYEVYRDEEAMAAHKATEHYACWRDRVAPWMAAERVGVKYTPLFPKEEAQWCAD